MLRSLTGQRYYFPLIPLIQIPREGNLIGSVEWNAALRVKICWRAPIGGKIVHKSSHYELGRHSKCSTKAIIYTNLMNILVYTF